MLVYWSMARPFVRPWPESEVEFPKWLDDMHIIGFCLVCLLHVVCLNGPQGGPVETDTSHISLHSLCLSLEHLWLYSGVYVAVCIHVGASMV